MQSLRSQINVAFMYVHISAHTSSACCPDGDSLRELSEEVTCVEKGYANSLERFVRCVGVLTWSLERRLLDTRIFFAFLNSILLVHAVP